MKATIKFKELYPFYCVEDLDLNISQIYDIDHETLKRWEKVNDDFVKVQLEISKLAKSIYIYKDKYNFIKLTEYEEDDCE